MKYFSFCLLFCVSCFSGQDEQHFPEVVIRSSAPNKMYARDSFYLAYTIDQFSKLDVVGYGYNFQRADIDTIIYSPDTLKLFAFVIDSFMDYTRKQCVPEYGGHAILAYRLRMNDPWIVYPVTVNVFVGYKNYNMVKERLRKAYFRDLRGYVYIYWNSEKKNFIEYTFYNVTDSLFWDNCILWKKDVSISGYYQFQLTGNGDPEMPNQILNIPQIHYPDSLLQLFYENRW